MVAALALVTAMSSRAMAVDYSPPPILQWFQASYDTMEDRSADMFLAGYGAVWIPPPGRGHANQQGSVGYDVFDRFDLGRPGFRTAYGTEIGIRSFNDTLHRFDARVHVDAVLNHNGFSDQTDADFATFRAAGGYPGFVMQDPDGGIDPNGIPNTHGDFFNPNPANPTVINTQLSNLIDIDHSRNHQLIRHPVVAGQAQNIPAGTTTYNGRRSNVPNATNARFYPDRDETGATYTDPGPAGTGNTFTFYPFDTDAPMEGDAVAENATGLLMRYMQWMVQDIGVDGFRLDAAKHMEHNALKYMDAAVYRSNPRKLLNGADDHVFMYGEVVPGDGQDPGQDERNFMQEYIRKDIDPNQPNKIGGNRDVLDFAQRGRMNDELSSNGFNNDFRDMVNYSMDTYDSNHNGSQGVKFVSNHDGGGAAMTNVAHAFILTQPGNAIVYHNAHEFGGFPEDGRGDALGNYGSAMTKLVQIRNTHALGNYRERWLEKEYYAMERGGSMLVALSNHNGTGVSANKTMSTDFPNGTHLVELTGNAAAYNAEVGSQALATALTVNASQQVTLKFLHNDGDDKGYLIYGLQTPQSSAGLQITNVSSVLEGGPVNAGSQFLNGTKRLADLQVVTGSTINVRLDTQAVTLPDGFRDVNADGDNALIRVNNGMDTNGSGLIDYRDPTDARTYGFEEFTAGNKSPGYSNANGNGWYQENIDATDLPEGYNFLTVRVFRHGAGGPTVFNDFRQVVYLDRFDPEASIVGLTPNPFDPSNNNDWELVARSVDRTADNMHILVDQPANLTESQILEMVNSNNQADRYDHDYLRDDLSIRYGNHVATVVTYEPTGRVNVQRIVGVFAAPTNGGRGFGDMNGSNNYLTSDIRELFDNNGSVEDVLLSQNSKFNAAFDLDANGLHDNRDLFSLEDVLVNAPVAAFQNSLSNKQNVLNAYTDVLMNRANVNATAGTGSFDVRDLYDVIDLLAGGSTVSDSVRWTMDMDVDGNVDTDDAKTMIFDLIRTAPGDFDLNGIVDSADWVIAQKWSGAGVTNANFTQGDADFDRDVDADDLVLWSRNYGFVRQNLVATAGSGGGGSAPVPEQSAVVLTLCVCGWFSLWRIKSRS
jgi:alpha-amylase